VAEKHEKTYEETHEKNMGTTTSPYTTNKQTAKTAMD